MLSPLSTSSPVNVPRHCSSFRAPGDGCGDGDGDGDDGDDGDCGEAAGEIGRGRRGIPIVRDKGGDRDSLGRGRGRVLECGNRSFRADAGARRGRMERERSMNGSVHVERYPQLRHCTTFCSCPRNMS